MRILLLFALAILLPACRTQREQPVPASAPVIADECSIRLADVASSTGIDFEHTDGSSGRRYIAETVSAGLAVFDYDADGDLDIYFVNGAALPGASFNHPPCNALYRNHGDWHFTDVTARAGVGDTEFGLGVTAGDYDNDGYQDLFVNNNGPNVLYHNNGDGTFDDVTTAAGIEKGNRLGAGASFLDIEGDGDLDLYVANYVKFTYETHSVESVGEHQLYVGPRSYPFEPDQLYRNNGDGTFTDISTESGIGSLSGSGMGVVCGDLDNDGDTDIFVLNDVAPNFLFQNDGTGRFDEIGLIAGVACNGSGRELGSMGVDCGDYDNDGWLDLFMTSYQNEMPVLYRNVTGGNFADVTAQTGAGDGCYSHVNWGTGLADLDNDGDRDLFIACGHLQDNVEQYDPSSAYEARNVLLMNEGRRFVNVSDRCGDGLRVQRSSRGAALDDLDGDGDVDIAILNSRRRPTLLRNDSQAGTRWLRVCLHGTRSNRDGVGSRVSVTAGGETQIDEVHSGRGYQSHWGSTLHFGLGQASRVDRIEVRWLGGGVQRCEDITADQEIVLIQSMHEPTPR